MFIFDLFYVIIYKKEEPRGPMIGVVLLLSRGESLKNYLSNVVDNLKMNSNIF
uniref:Uncharacterized protein n=1 Tax=Vitis vinifera TaxID=29760 RepID=F6GTM3_VITVI